MSPSRPKTPSKIWNDSRKAAHQPGQSVVDDYAASALPFCPDSSTLWGRVIDSWGGLFPGSHPATFLCWLTRIKTSQFRVHRGRICLWLTSVARLVVWQGQICRECAEVFVAACRVSSNSARLPPARARPLATPRPMPDSPPVTKKRSFQKCHGRQTVKPSSVSAPVL